MTELRHYDHDGRVRFVTFSCHRCLPLLTNRPFRMAVTDAVDSARLRHDLRILGYVIMPEHVHLVLHPTVESELGRIIGGIKEESAVSILSALEESCSPLLARLSVTRDGSMKRALWQRRCYDHNCRAEEDVWEKVNYCHYNPVKRGLVTDPSRWEFSSFNSYQGATEVPLRVDMMDFAGSSHPSGGAPTALFPLSEADP